MKKELMGHYATIFTVFIALITLLGCSAAVRTQSGMPELFIRSISKPTPEVIKIFFTVANPLDVTKTMYLICRDKRSFIVIGRKKLVIPPKTTKNEFMFMLVSSVRQFTCGLIDYDKMQ